jgi:pimeloyl-ACP methyl ester carboxylesterase
MKTLVCVLLSVTVVIKGKGHWLMEEAPQQVIPQLVAFINKS